MRNTKLAKHSLRLRTMTSMAFLAAGLENGLGAGQETVRAVLLAPSDAPREEPAVGAVEFCVVVHC